MGQFAREHVVDNFSASIMTRKLQSCVEQAMAMTGCDETKKNS